MPRGERREWVLPNEPAPVRLMNTIWADRDGSHDDLLTVGDLEEWLGGTRLCDRGTRPTTSALDEARALRGALRAAAAHATSDPRPIASSIGIPLPDAVRTINGAASGRAAPALRVGSDGFDRADPSKRDCPSVALGHVAAEFVELVTGAGAPQLRACMAPGCVLYFVKDHPRRAWCSPSCGNRARVARHYMKTHATAPVR